MILHNPPLRWGLIGWGGPALRRSAAMKRLLAAFREAFAKAPPFRITTGYRSAVEQAVHEVKREWKP